MFLIEASGEFTLPRKEVEGSIIIATTTVLVESIYSLPFLFCVFLLPIIYHNELIIEIKNEKKKNLKWINIKLINYTY